MTDKQRHERKYTEPETLEENPAPCVVVGEPVCVKNHVLVIIVGKRAECERRFR